MKYKITSTSFDVYFNGKKSEILSIPFSKIEKTKCAKYHGGFGYYGNHRSKSWLTKEMDNLFFLTASQIKKIPKGIKKKLINYIPDGLYYPKYNQQMKLWI